MKNKSSKTAFDIFPLLRKKYLSILILLAIIGILLPGYLHGDGALLQLSYGVLTFLALGTLGLHQNINFRRLSIKLRPFVVARILQIAASLAAIVLIIVTFKNAQIEGQFIPHIILWLLALGVVIQYFGIFRLAREAKDKHPERCDFC
ncbi:hypothetical protein COV82_01195 [Candidatus Peregrinibacteria bacterium CG11_big_fil_rev_8_21_14_0_20_46_8]|nr:MAG: hypothetical protein COV82_01195 [Candidatus Peregrinibacteria bacterium CG11_big_fil_rev_8_21_14_0_20_46_8]